MSNNRKKIPFIPFSEERLREMTTARLLKYYRRILAIPEERSRSEDAAIEQRSNPAHIFSKEDARFNPYRELILSILNTREHVCQKH